MKRSKKRQSKRLLKNIKDPSSNLMYQNIKLNRNLEQQIQVQDKPAMSLGILDQEKIKVLVLKLTHNLKSFQSLIEPILKTHIHSLEKTSPHPRNSISKGQWMRNYMRMNKLSVV